MYADCSVIVVICWAHLSPCTAYVIDCSWKRPTLIDGFINKFLFPILSFPNSTDGQQVPQQSPPTLEVTPPDSHSDGNGVMEEQTEGDGLYKE